MRISLGIPMNIKNIALAAGGIIKSDYNEPIRYVTTDSREVQSENAQPPMAVTLSGMVTDVRAVQFTNVLS